MKSKFRFIIDKFEMPMLKHNEAWCTNIWVYLITGIIGALTGWQSLRLYFTGATFQEAASICLTYGWLYTMVCWCGCAATAFIQIPERKYAINRCIFNLIAVALTFYICAILSVLAFFVICIMIIGLCMSAASSSSKKSSASASDAPDTVYDGEGNQHYVSSSIGNDRVVDTDGRTMRREADGTYREI